MVRHSRGSYIVAPIHCRLWSGHTRIQSNSLALSSTSNKVVKRCRNPSYERLLEGCISPFFMRTRRTPHGTSRFWCKQYLPVVTLVKTRDVFRPGVVGGARVYGHTTTRVPHAQSDHPRSLLHQTSDDLQRMFHHHGCSTRGNIFMYFLVCTKDYRSNDDVGVARVWQGAPPYFRRCSGELV